MLAHTAVSSDWISVDNDKIDEWDHNEIENRNFMIKNQREKCAEENERQK